MAMPYMAYGIFAGMIKTTLYLPEDLRHRLKSVAHRAQRSEADLVREALEAYLRQQAHPLPSSVGAGEDSELAARDGEAWLAARWRRR